MTFCTCILVQTKTDRRHAHVIHSAVLLFPFAVSRMVVVRWQIAFYSYMSSHLAFLAVNMELSGTTRQVPSFGI
jgi:hypothetical protein